MVVDAVELILGKINSHILEKRRTVHRVDARKLLSMLSSGTDFFETSEMMAIT